MPDPGKSSRPLDRSLSRFQTGCWFVLGNLFLAAFCLWGAYAAYVDWKLQTGGDIAAGTVTRLETVKTSEGMGYAPVVEFEFDGQPYSFESDSVSKPPEYEIGEQVEVRYLTADPDSAQINTSPGHWLLPAAAIPAMLVTALILNRGIIRAWRRGEAFGE